MPWRCRPRRRRCGRARRGRRPRRGRRRRSRASSRIATRRSSAPATRSAASIAASRHSPSAACSPPPAARCHAVAASSAARAGATCPSARRTRPRWTRASAARRTSPVASAFSIASSSVAAPVVVVTGLALRSSEAGQLVRLRLQEAETSRRLRGATDVEDGVVEPVLDAGQLAEHRVAANVQPRVVDRSQPVLDLIASLDARAPGHRPRSRLWRRRASSRPDPTAGPARRRARWLRSVSSIAWRNSP